jgi:hypothetical protein
MYIPKAFSHSALGAICAAALVLSLPGVAAAQPVPSYGTQPPPAYATPVGHQESIKGTLTGFDGQYVVYMRDARGYNDHVTLHQGTVINPTGIKLVEGMQVQVWGYSNGPTFQADTVEVNGTGYYGGGNYYPNYGYGGYGYGDSGYGGYGYGGYGGYGYPYSGYGYGYPFGVSIGFGWGWGWGGPWGWPGWWGPRYPYYGFRGCCGYYRYPYGYRGFNGGGFNRGGFNRGGTIHGNVQGAPRGGMTRGGTVTGGGRGMSGGRPPRR